MKKVPFLFTLIGLFSCLCIADELITIPNERSGNRDNFNLISTVISGDQCVWIGTESGNVFRTYQVSNGWKIEKAVSIPKEKIACLYWADSALIIGTDKSIYVLGQLNKGQNTLSEKILDLNTSPLMICKGKKSYCIVTRKSVFLGNELNKNSFKEIKYTSTNKLVIHSAFSGYERIYIETDKGLSEIFYDSEIPARVNKDNSLNGVRLISGDYRNGEMWFGTTFGLFSYKSLDTLWTKYDIDNDLPDIAILSTAWFGHYLLLGTMRGPTLFNTENNKCVKLTIPDSLKDEPVNNVLNYNNKMIIGYSAKGLLIKDLPDIPCVYFGKLEIKKDSILIHGAISGSKIKSVNFFYSPNISPLMNISNCFSMKSTKDNPDIISTWDIREITDGDYILGARIENQSGVSNVSLQTVSINQNKIEIILDPIPEYSPVEKLSISGICSNSFKPIIQLSPNGSEIQFQNERMGFKGTVLLSEGMNKVVIAMYDPKNGEKLTDVFRNVIYDKISPKLTVDPYYIAHDSVFNISGRYSDDNPDRIEIYCRKDTVKSNLPSSSFTLPVKIPYGKNELKLSAFDKAGNRTDKKITVLFDTIPPSFAYIECPAYTNLDSVTVTGFFTEDNIESIYILPFNKRADIDMTSAKFSAKIPLHEGPNAIECVIKDQAGMSSVEKIWITRDFTSPVIKIDTVPLVTSKSTITITGSVKDKYFNTIKVSEPNILVDCNQQEQHFEFDWSLKSGKNKIIITAFDLAGNQSNDTVQVNCNQKTIGIDSVKTYKEMQEKVTRLEQENTLLKQRIISCEQTAKNDAAAINVNKNRYIIYKTKKDETLYYLSQKFYGRINYYWRIAEFNNLKDKDALLPGQEIKIPIIGDDFSRSVWSDSAKSSFVRISAQVGYIRQTPNMNAPVAGVLIKNDMAEVIEKKDDWCKVQTAQGVIGWINNNLLEK